MRSVIIYVTILICFFNCKTDHRSKYRKELDRLSMADPEEARILFLNPPIIKELQRIYPDKIITQDFNCEADHLPTGRNPNWYSDTYHNVEFWTKLYGCTHSSLQRGYPFKLAFYKPVPDGIPANNGNVEDMNKNRIGYIKIQKYCVINFYNFRIIGSKPEATFPWKEKDNLLRLNKFHLHLRDMYFESGSDLCSKEELPDLP